MNILVENLPGDIVKVVLDGRLDVAGSASIEAKLDLIASTREAVLLDLQLVSFISSIGLRTLVMPARTIKNRGGRVVLFGPNEMVGKVLKTSGIDSVIPVHQDLSTALAALQ